MSAGLLVAQAAAAAAAVAGLAGLRAVLAGRRRRGPADPRPGRTPRIVRGTRRDRLEVRLRRGGLALSPDLFVLAVGAAAAALSLAGWWLVRSPVVVPAAVGAAGLGTRALLASTDRRYLRRVAAQLPATSGALASSVSAGLSLRQAISRAARDAPEPIRGELGRVSDELALGARLEESLDALADRLPDPDLRIMVTAILVQRQTGGNLARALADLAERLDERVRLEREVRGATAQARMSAWLVAGLPAAGGAVIELAAPGALARALGQGIGLVILSLALALGVTGVLLIRRLARVEW